MYAEASLIFLVLLFFSCFLSCLVRSFPDDDEQIRTSPTFRRRRSPVQRVATQVGTRVPRAWTRSAVLASVAPFPATSPVTPFP